MSWEYKPAMILLDSICSDYLPSYIQQHAWKTERDNSTCPPLVYTQWTQIMAARFNISFFRQLQAICLYIKINLEQLKLLNNNVSINLHSAGIILKFPLLFERRKFIQSNLNMNLERMWKDISLIFSSSAIFSVRNFCNIVSDKEI